MIEAKLSSLKSVKVHEYAIRFLFGGLCTVAAGVIAKRFGPGIGGLFLAFPAIFPASASLVEKHEKEKKGKAGFNGSLRGRIAAGMDSVGAAIGCLGLIGFAATLTIGLREFDAVITLCLAVSAWTLISTGSWFFLRSRTLRHFCSQVRSSIKD